MAEEEEEEEAAAEVVAAREKVVLRGSTFDTHFEVGQIPVAGGASFSSIILVGELDPRLVVCLPLAVWNRKVAQRLFPSKGLLKPVACSLVCCDVESREPIDGDITVRAWLGFLSAGLEETINFGREEGPDHMFGGGACLPLQWWKCTTRGSINTRLQSQAWEMEVEERQRHLVAKQTDGEDGGGHGSTSRRLFDLLHKKTVSPSRPSLTALSWARGQNFLEASDGDGITF